VDDLGGEAVAADFGVLPVEPKASSNVVRLLRQISALPATHSTISTK
jgi:hypothetical protein